MGSQQKKKKGTGDQRNTISDLKREADQDAIRTAIQPVFEGTTFTPLIVTQKDFVEIWESIDPSQTNAPTAPAQVTGLNVVTGSNNNTLNLSWTASGSVGVIYYKIYRSLTTGTEVLINVSYTNSYSDDNLLSGTQYFYKVSAFNAYGLEGTLSAEVNATTTGIKPPMLQVHLDSNFNDTSPNAHNTLGNNGNGFLSPGQFGDAWKCNYPLSPPSIPAYDFLYWANHPTLQLNLSVGFSFSIWVYPVTFGVARKWLMLKADDINNEFVVAIEPTTLIVQFHVKKAASDFKRQTSTGLTVNAWNHVAGTFNGSSNVIEVYKNAVAGVASTAATSYQNTTSGEFKVGDIIGGPATIDNKIQGYIDEINFWQNVLTPTQITNLMNTNSP